MSQKAFCPRGHIWDPSMLGGLPPSETPCCPICGEEETPRGRRRLARLGRWCRDNPPLAGLSVLCLVLLLAACAGFVYARREMRAIRAEAETAQFEKQQAETKLSSARRVQEKEESQRQRRETEIQDIKWTNREKEFQAQLLDAVKAASAARKQRDEQFQARALAEELARTAEEVRKEALIRRAETARQLIKMYVADGTRRMESGDLSAAAAWFVEALRLAEKEKLPQETHRLRLAAVLAHCPRPIRLWPHDQTLNVVQLSGDGKRVMTAGGNGAVELWETATGKRVGEVLAHAEAVTHAALSPDGKRVLSASADGMLHLWDVESGKEVMEAEQLMAPLVGMAFSPDGKRFLVVTDKAPMAAMGPTEVEIHIREAATGAALRMDSLGSELRPLLAKFSPDGKRVLTVCQDRCARIWDIAGGKQVGSSFGHEAAVIAASFSSEGERVLTASADGTARVWHTKTGEPATPILKQGVSLRGARFSPDGRHVLTFDEASVRVWDADTGDERGPRLRHGEAVSDARFSADGRYVLTTCGDGAARIWDYRTGQEILPALRHGDAIRYAAFTPAGDAVLTLAGRLVRLWDLTAGEAPQPPAPPTEIGLVLFSLDGKRVLRATQTSVRVYDTATNAPVGGTLPHKNKVTAAAFSADGKRLLTVSHQPNGDEMEGHIRVWETASGELLGQPLIHPRSVLEASFSRDGRRVLTACQDGKARLWDVDKNDLVGEPMVHKQDLQRALFLPGGKHLLTVDVEGGLRLWDADKAEAIGPIWGHKKPIRHLAFSAEDRLLATASDDGTARVWEADTGQEIATMAVPGVPVLYAAFAPDAKRLVTVGEDRRVRVWDAGNGKPLGSPLKHRAAVSLAAFSEDGKRLATVDADGVRLWDAANGEPIGPVMPLASDLSTIHAVALGRDGRLVLTFGTSGDPAARWVRDLHAEERSAAELSRLVEVLTGERRTDAGEWTPLDDAAQSKVWQDVHTKYAQELSPSPQRVAAWQRRAAKECEERQSWMGAFAHLDYLINIKPSPDLYARRGRVHAKLRHWQAAKADYAKALTGDAARWDLWAGRAEAEAALGRWEEAVADYSKAIERRSDRAALWTARGRIEAERGAWNKAATDLGKAIHLGEQEAIVWCQYILTLRANGDEANYRRWCGRLVQRFGDNKDEAIARRVAWTCALAEGALRDWKPLLKRAESLAAAHPRSADPVRLVALLLYRAGRFEDSLKASQKVTEGTDPKPQALDWLLMALAAQRLGRGDEAKKWFDKAKEVRGQEKNDKESWEYRLVYQTLHREAETLLKGNNP
jgi:WD40 repeat protein/tetratricopeptide (TPR) repeat protein